MSAGIIVPSFAGPIWRWDRKDVEHAFVVAMLKIAALEAENANLTALIREQLVRTAEPIGNRETLPAPPPDGCNCDEEKTDEKSWLDLAEGD